MTRETRRQRKQEAKARRAQERRRQERRQRFTQLGLLSLVLFFLGYFGYWAYGKISEPVTWRELPSQGHAHIPTPTTPHVPYNSDPPTSGPHTPYVARWGAHTRPVPKEEQVHNLEDGGVVVQYNCPDGCPELVEKLEAIARRYKLIVLAPYPGMEERIALTAWRRIDTFDEFDERRIVRFIDDHIGIDHHPR